MNSVETLVTYSPPEYSVLGRVDLGPGETFVASADLVNAAGDRVPLTFLADFPHNTAQGAKAQVVSFAQGYGYRIAWDD
jgi:hypothetical protein